jgi:hypothetical protein
MRAISTHPNGIIHTLPDDENLRILAIKSNNYNPSFLTIGLNKPISEKNGFKNCIFDAYSSVAAIKYNIPIELLNGPIEEVKPKLYNFLLDCSGSMNGKSGKHYGLPRIVNLKKVLFNMLNNLIGKGIKINIMWFNHEVFPFKSDNSDAGNSVDLDVSYPAIKDFISQKQADGGTDLNKALKLALQSNPTKVFVFTDADSLPPLDLSDGDLPPIFTIGLSDQADMRIPDQLAELSNGCSMKLTNDILMSITKISKMILPYIHIIKGNPVAIIDRFDINIDGKNYDIIYKKFPDYLLAAGGQVVDFEAVKLVDFEALVNTKYGFDIQPGSTMIVTIHYRTINGKRTSKTINIPFIGDNKSMLYGIVIASKDVGLSLEYQVPIPGLTDLVYFETSPPPKYFDEFDEFDRDDSVMRSFGSCRSFGVSRSGGDDDGDDDDDCDRGGNSHFNDSVVVTKSFDSGINSPVEITTPEDQMRMDKIFAILLENYDGIRFINLNKYQPKVNEIVMKNFAGIIDIDTMLVEKPHFVSNIIALALMIYGFTTEYKLNLLELPYISNANKYLDIPNHITITTQLQQIFEEIIKYFA